MAMPLVLAYPSFMPHGHCYFWRPEMVWLQVLSNLAIGLSYVSISVTLLVLTRRLRGIPFSRAYLAFGLFIVSCGVTHFMDIVTVWDGMYWLDGAIRAFTALASAATAVWLFPLFPRVVAFGTLLGEEREMSRAALQQELAKSQALQRAVAAKEQQFRELVDNLSDLAWSAGPDGKVDFANRRFYEYTGATPDQLGKGPLYSAHDPAMLEPVLARWRASLSSGEPFEMEFPLRGTDGTFRWFLTRVRPLRDEEGKIARWIGTNTDIDDQRRARAELQKAIEKRDEFMSIAAHELRTPLAALTLQLEIAARAGDVKSATSRLGAAAKQVERMTTLVDEMLDISRIGVGRFELEVTEVDVPALLREVVARTTHRAEAAGCAITIDTPAAFAGMYDGSRLDQVFTNLLANAIKYGAGKPIHIAMTTASGLEVSVRDEGIGIAPADRERIFERFERGVSTRHYGGFGLGLFIVREIVRAHGGDVVVESELGKGSTFRVHLPTS